MSPYRDRISSPTEPSLAFPSPDTWQQEGLVRLDEGHPHLASPALSGATCREVGKGVMVTTVRRSNPLLIMYELTLQSVGVCPYRVFIYKRIINVL